MHPSSRLLTLLLAALNLTLLAVSAVYTAAALRGIAPLDKPLFLGLLIVGAAANLAIVALLARHWPRHSLRFRLFLVYWGWFVFWFWAFAPVYFLLVLNLSALQVKWAWFLFVWEVIGFGLVFVIIGDRLIAPLDRYLRGSRKVSPTEAKRLYERVVRFPFRAAAVIIGLSAAGFALGAFMVHLLAGFSFIEAIKNYGIGFTAATFLAVIYYVSTYRLFEPLRSELKLKGKLGTDARASIARRFVIVAVFIVAGSFLLYQMLVIKSYQGIVRDELATTLASDIARGAWSPSVMAYAAQVNGADRTTLEALRISAEDVAYVTTHRQGILDDFQDQVKLIGFFTAPDGTRSVVIIPMLAYYGPLVREVGWTFGSAFLVFLAGVAIARYSARTLTRSILELTRAVHRLNEDPRVSIPRLATGDETEELSDALSRYVAQVQQLDEEKSEFISIASHHLRTPVTQLLWTIQTIERSSDPRAETVVLLPELKLTALHLTELVETLLNTHRFDNAQGSVLAAPVDLVQFMKTAIARYAPLADQRLLSVSLVAPETMPLVSDPTMLTIIIESLLSNAIAYTPDRGAVVLTLAQADGKVTLTCADTGIGIPPEYADRVFTKFQRADNAMRMRPNGTGLGLYIAQKAAAQLGGSISYVSTVGKGTTFTVVLPDTPLASSA